MVWVCRDVRYQVDQIYRYVKLGRIGLLEMTVQTLSIDIRRLEVVRLHQETNCTKKLADIRIVVEAKLVYVPVSRRPRVLPNQLRM